MSLGSNRSGNRTGQLLVSIGDAGVRLLRERVDQTFNALFSTKSYGTGTGLTISGPSSSRMAARLWAVVNSGQGATFRFTLTRTIGRRYESLRNFILKHNCNRGWNRDTVLL